MEDSTNDSSLQETAFAAVRINQVDIQRCIGNGAFSNVYASYIPDLPVPVAPPVLGEIGSMRSDSTEDTTDLDYSSNHSSLPMVRPCFALKRLREDVLEDEESKNVAVRDFTLEATILMKIPYHPNIVRLIATSQNFSRSPAEGFLVVERLNTTLQFQLSRWANQSRQMKRTTTGFFGIAGKIKSLEMQEQRHRIQCCALGISKALQHLHKHRIIYRDLKPQNVGFAPNGQVKLFDMGLARQVDHQDGSRRLTGAAGTARYMAPEVAGVFMSFDCNYGLSADVYSFAVLLWEICTLQKPFEKARSIQEWYRTVVTQGKRPNVRKVASLRMRELVQACWDSEPNARPTFALISAQLERESTATYAKQP